MNKHFINILYMKSVRWCLTCILLFLPFQYKIAEGIELWSNDFASILRRLDEIAIIIFLPLSIIALYKKKEIFNWLYLILLLPIFILCTGGLISGLINGNSIAITVHGTFDYIKNFLVIFIFAAFIRDFNELKRIFRLLLIVAVFIGVVAFIEESWVLFNRYIVKIDISGSGISVLSDILPNIHLDNRWRFGIYRTSSLMAHYNVLGLYSLCILTLYLHIEKKINYAIFFSLFTGIFVSVSRMIYASALLVIGSQIFRRRWIMILVFIPIVITIFYMISMPDFDLLNIIEGKETNLSEIPYRVYAREKAMEVWKDHPLWGVGPGMFGGAIAAKYNSPVYEEYNFALIVRWFGSLDQFWPQILAEMGIIGTGAFISLFIGVFILRQQASSDEIKGLFTGIILFTISLFIYTLGGNLNVNDVMFTYCAFIGMGLGCESSYSFRLKG